MATRIYLPSSGAAPVTPSDWEFATQISPSTFAGVTARIGSASTTYSQTCSTTSPHTDGALRWVIGPLAAQSISGTVEGQMRCRESNAGANATLAISCKIIQPDGTDRAILLAPTASDSATSPHEMVTTLTNRIFEDVSEVSDITLTTQSATAGDYLVIEVGFRTATTVGRTIELSYGDVNAVDLTDDNTTETTALNPWIEFTATLTFLSSISGTADMVFGAGSSTLIGSGALAGTAAIAFGGGSSTLTGSGALSGSAALTFTGSGTIEELSAGHPVGILTQLSYGGILPGQRYSSFAGKSALSQIAGTTDITISGSATLAGAGALVGAADITLTGSGTLLGAGDLTGSTAITFTPSGTILGAGALLGSAAIVFAEGTSTLSGAGALIGSGAITFGAGSSALSGAGALAGSSAIVFGEGSSALTGVGALAASLPIVFDASGTLDQPSGSISGSTVIAFTSTGTLTGAGAMLGAAELALAGAGTLAGSGAIAGVSAIIFDAIGATVGSGALSGSLAIVFAASGTVAQAAAVSLTASALAFLHGTDRNYSLLSGSDRSLKELIGPDKGMKTL